MFCYLLMMEYLYTRSCFEVTGASPLRKHIVAQFGILHDELKDVVSAEHELLCEHMNVVIAYAEFVGVYKRPDDTPVDSTTKKQSNKFVLDQDEELVLPAVSSDALASFSSNAASHSGGSTKEVRMFSSVMSDDEDAVEMNRKPNKSSSSPVTSSKSDKKRSLQDESEPESEIEEPKQPVKRGRKRAAVQKEESSDIEAEVDDASTMY